MTGLLIDISAKQKYIFNSNMLKINIGASYIMDKEILEKQIAISFSILLKKTTNSFAIDDFEDKVAYIGGGNALLLFKDHEEAKAFNKIYSKQILENFPGVYVNLTYLDGFSSAEDEYKAYMNAIRQHQKRQVHTHSNVNEPHVFGIEQEDAILGKPVTHRSKILKDVSAEQLQISKETATKVNAARASEKHYNDVLKICDKDDKFTTTNEISEIVPDQDKGYMAVVHIDGNKMGNHFANCSSLASFKEASTKLKTNLDSILEAVFNDLIKLIDTSTGEIIIDSKNKIKCTNVAPDETGKWVVPFRPIIHAGDDITFVCHGRLGYYLAEFYLKKMREKGIYACAGVAIAHTKFPFYKAYQLAEELCDQGKKASRNFQNSSWIQFYRSTGGFAGELDALIEHQFNNQFKDQPYSVGFELSRDAEKSCYTANKELLEVVHELKKWSNAKIMQLRDALKIEAGLDTFFKIAESKNEKHTLDEKFQKQPKLLFDAIEMTGFVLPNNDNDEEE